MLWIFLQALLLVSSGDLLWHHREVLHGLGPGLLLFQILWLWPGARPVAAYLFSFLVGWMVWLGLPYGNPWLAYSLVWPTLWARLDVRGETPAWFRDLVVMVQLILLMVGPQGSLWSEVRAAVAVGTLLQWARVRPANTAVLTFGLGPALLAAGLGQDWRQALATTSVLLLPQRLLRNL